MENNGSTREIPHGETDSGRKAVGETDSSSSSSPSLTYSTVSNIFLFSLVLFITCLSIALLAVVVLGGGVGGHGPRPRTFHKIKKFSPS